MTRRHDPRAVPLFDAIAGLDTHDAAGIEEAAPISLPETGPRSAAAPSPANRVPHHDLGGSPRRRRASRGPAVFAGAASMFVAAMAAGTLTRPNRSQPSPVAPTPPAAGAPEAAETGTAAPPPTPAPGARPRSPRGAAHTRPDRLPTQEVSQAPRGAARSTALTGRAPEAVGNPAGEFAP